MAVETVSLEAAQRTVVKSEIRVLGRKGTACEEQDQEGESLVHDLRLA